MRLLVSERPAGWNDMVKCTDCDKEFNAQEGLQHHREAKHGAAKKIFVMKKRYYWYGGLVLAVGL